MRTRTWTLAVATVAATLGMAVWQAAPLAEWGLPRLAGWYGLAPLRLHVASLGPSHVVLEDVALGPAAAPDLAAERIVLSAPWAALRRGRVESVAVEGLRARARWTDGGLSWGALDALAEGEDAGGAGGALPFDVLTVGDGEAEIALPGGPLHLLFDARLAAPAAGGLTGTLDALVRHDAGWLRGRAALALEPAGDAALEIDLVEGEAATTGFALRLGGGHLDLSWPSGAVPRGTLDVAVDRLAVAGRSFSGLALEGGLDGTALRVALAGGAAAPGLSVAAQAAVSDVSADAGAVTAEARLQLGDLARDPAGEPLPFGASVGGSVDLRLDTTVGELRSALGGAGGSIRPEADLDLALRAGDAPGGPLQAAVAGRLAAVWSSGRLRLATAPDFSLTLRGNPPGFGAAATLALSPAGGAAVPLAVDLDLAHGLADMATDLAFRLSGDGQGEASGSLSGNAVFDLATLAPRRWHVVDLTLSGGPLAIAGHRLDVTAARLGGTGGPDAVDVAGGVAVRYDGEPVPGLSVAAGGLAFDGQVTWRDGTLSVLPAGCVTLEAGRVAWSPSRIAADSLALCLEATQPALVRWSPAAPAAGQLALAAAARLTAPLDIQAPPGSLRLARLEIAAQGDRDDLSGRLAVAADRASADRPLRLRGGGLSVAGDYSWRDGTLRFAPEGCVTLAARDLAASGFALTAPVEGCVTAASQPLLSLGLGETPSAAFSASLAPVTLAGRLGGGDDAHAVSGKLPGVDVQASWRPGAWSARAAAGGGDLLLDDRWKLAGLKARLTSSGSAGLDDAELQVEALAFEDAAPAPLVAPVGLSGSAFVVERSLRFDAEVADTGGLLSLKAQGRHDLVSGAGEATFASPTVVFGPGHQPQQLLPVLRGLVTSVRGSLDLSGGAAWGDGDVSSSMEVHLAGGAVSTRVAELGGIDASARFDSLWPPSTPPGQTLSIAEADVGVPLEDVRVTFQVLPQGAVLVERAAWPWMGGTVQAAGVTLDPADTRHAMVLEVEDVDITRILDVIDLDDLAGTGRLSGSIPVEVVNGTPYIRNGRLTAEQGGVLSYTSPGVDGALRGGGQGGALLADALKDFRYRSLVLELDGQTTGAVTARVLLAGSNPELYDGYPIELNTSFEGDLGQIMRGARAAYGITDTIREGLDAPAEDAAPPPGQDGN